MKHLFEIFPTAFGHHQLLKSNVTLKREIYTNVLSLFIYARCYLKIIKSIMMKYEMLDFDCEIAAKTQQSILLFLSLPFFVFFFIWIITFEIYYFLISVKSSRSRRNDFLGGNSDIAYLLHCLLSAI